MPQKLQLQKVIKMSLKLDLSPSHQDDHGFLLRIHPLLPEFVTFQTLFADFF